MDAISGIFAGLTPQQARAAAQAGPVLVLAGAGTGKTKTLTRAVAHRIEIRGIPAGRILAVTFTNKAAAEMSARIRAALDRHLPWARRPPAPHRAGSRRIAAGLRHPGCRRQPQDRQAGDESDEPG